jgi:GNAT superfamily N-acetyltransferase
MKDNFEIEIKVDNHRVAWIEVFRGQLEFIGVDPSYRGRGLSVKLVQMLFLEMKKLGIRKLTFFNNNIDFWENMKNKFPKNIRFCLNGYGVITLN